MKIAFIGQKGIPASYGGVERHVEEIATRLVAIGHSVFVYCRPWYTKNLPASFKGVRLIYMRSVRTKHLDTITHVFLSTLHALRDGVQIIHFHGVGPSLLAWIPKLFSPGIKVLVTFHSPDRLHEKWGLIARCILTMAEWMACHIADETITVSRTLRAYANTRYKTHTTYIPNGAPLPLRIPVDIQKATLKKWNLEKGKYILGVARFIPHKGIHYLIDAYQRWGIQYPNKARGMKLVLVGDTSYTDAYAHSLKVRAHNDPSIIFTGFQKPEVLAALYKNARLFVHPSTSEGLPFVVLEAMQYGTPTLLSDIPEHKELIRNPQFLFQSKNIQHLADRLQYLLKNPSLLREQKKELRTVIKNEYDWKDIVQKTAYLYEDHIPRYARLLQTAEG